MKRFLNLLMYLLISIAVYSQEPFTITGTVTDENGEPMIGANVVEKGTTNGTVTNMDGDYEITVSGPSSTIIFSFLGYLAERIQVDGQNVIDIQLIPDLTSLDEVVVVGYGTLKKEDLTGSVSVVNMDEIKNSPTLSAENVLQGNTSGVRVTSSNGAPGSPISVQIRGVGTPNNTDPLYIVDGMPIKDASIGKEDNPSGINFLNPADIESMQILKDASAAAIYGTRGANGVVIITTKKGKAGETRVNFNTSYGWQTLRKKLDVLNSQEFASLQNEIHGNVYDPATISSLETTDWQDEVFRTAPISNNQLSFSGGNEKSTYYISFNTYNQKGILKESGYDKYSVRVNANNKIKPWLKVGETFSYSVTDHQRQRERGTSGNSSPIAAALYAEPTQPVYTPDGNWSYISKANATQNPVSLYELRNYTYKTDRIQGSAFAEITFIEGLQYKLNVGIDNSWGKLKEFIPYYQIGADEGNSIPNIKKQHETYNTSIIENTLNYSKMFDNHSFSALAGYTYQYYKKDNTVAIGEFTPNEEIGVRDAQLGAVINVKSVGGLPEEDVLISYLGRINYTYANKYLVTASFRRDGSSRFGKKNRFSNFPSFSLGWKLSEESFLGDAPSITLLKLRAGWGQTGNYNINRYQYTVSAVTQPDAGLNPPIVYFGDPVSKEPRLLIRGVANPYLQWETTKTLNFGLDLNLFNNQLQTTLDVFNKRTTDLLLEKPVPESAGVQYGNSFINAGEINNKGVEVAITYKNSIGELKYEIGGNMTKLYNEVVSLEGGRPLSSGNATSNEFTVKMIEGESIGQIYGYVADGIFTSQDEIEAHAYQSSRTKPGDLKFKDLNQDGFINAEDITSIGQAFPDIMYGFNLEVSYKIFDLSVFSYGVYGNQVVNDIKRMGLYNLDLTTNVSPDLLNYYGRELEGGGIIYETDIPTLGYSTNNNNRPSSFFVEDGDFYRIKNITLGINLPQQLLSKWKVSNLRIYGTVQNPFVFTKYSGYDPEIGKDTGWNANPLAFGIDAGNYPVPRTYVLGLNLSF